MPYSSPPHSKRDSSDAQKQGQDAGNTNDAKGQGSKKQEIRILAEKPRLSAILKSGVKTTDVLEDLLKAQAQGTELIRRLSKKLGEVVNLVRWSRGVT